MQPRITLGLLVDQLVSGYARLLIHGAAEGSRRCDANLIVFSGRVLGTPRGHEYQNNVIFDFIRPGTIDALLMATGTQGSFLSLDQLREYTRRRFGAMPVVSIGIRFDGMPSVLSDNRTGILEAMDHLVDVHKARRIAFLKGPENNEEAATRFAAYREAIRARGLDDAAPLWLQGDFTQAGARRALSQYLGRHGRPGFQALVAANDEMAIGAVQILREHGFSVPGDVAVIGFDNIADSQFVVPSITTVGQSIAEQGRTAAVIAAGLARGEPQQPEIVLPARLVLRTSCGCLPRAVSALDALPDSPGSAERSEAESIADRCVEDPGLRAVLARLIFSVGTDGFITTLAEALNEQVAARKDIAPWQSLLTVLQGELIRAARSAREVSRLHRSFQKALMLLSDMLRLEQGRSLAELQGHLTQLRHVMERLISVASIAELMNDLADELDRLDIRTCFVACYPEEVRHHRSEPWVIPAQAEMTLACLDGKRMIPAEGERFFSPSDGFLPLRFLPSERPFMLMTTAIFYREDQIGYIAFEPGERDNAIYETFCVQLGSLLKGSLLFSARQKMIEALASERALLAILMDTIPDYIYFKDERSRFILVNRSMAKILGVSGLSQAVGKTDFDFFSAEGAQAAFDAEQAILRSGQPIIDIEEKETGPDGRVTWVSTTKMPLRNPTGEIVGTFGVSKDITERRRAEERILRLATLVESSGDAFFGLNMQDLVTSWNTGAERVYGFTADEIVGMPASTLMAPETVTETRHYWEEVRSGQVIRSFEAAGRRKDGSSVQMMYTLSPIRDERGAAVGIAIIARDMTADKILQARLIQAQRLESLGTLAGGIAHQFNNINAVVKGYLDALLDLTDLSPTTRLYGLEAMKGVNRLIDITERLQGLTSGAKVGEETCRLDEIVKSLLPVFEQRFEESGTKIVLDVRATPLVRMHRSRAGYILTSLLNNSLDSLLDRPERKLTIRTAPGPQTAFLEVTDSGCGISQENITRLFTPFFTMKGEWAPSGSSQTKVRGVGLSLSICRSAVSESGGRIDVESVLGAGSTFRVWLPSAD